MPLRSAIPHALTTLRLCCGAAAVAAALDGRLYAAATLITLGAVTDGLDGYLSRRLGVASAAGAIFDYIADYACFVVAPWTLTRVLAPPGGWPAEVLVGSVLATGAIRYVRNGAAIVAGSTDNLPGLGTVFFAFLSVTAVFLDAADAVRASGGVVPVAVFVFAGLMVAPVRYPKLARFPGASPVALVLLAAMPFIATRWLAGAAVVLGVGYALLAPLAARLSRGGGGLRMSQRREP